MFSWPYQCIVVGTGITLSDQWLSETEVFCSWLVVQALVCCGKPSSLFLPSPWCQLPSVMCSRGFNFIAFCLGWHSRWISVPVWLHRFPAWQGLFRYTTLLASATCTCVFFVQCQDDRVARNHVFKLTLENGMSCFLQTDSQYDMDRWWSYVHHTYWDSVFSGTLCCNFSRVPQTLLGFCLRRRPNDLSMHVHKRNEKQDTTQSNCLPVCCLSLGPCVSVACLCCVWPVIAVGRRSSRPWLETKIHTTNVCRQFYILKLSVNPMKSFGTYHEIFVFTGGWEFCLLLEWLQQNPQYKWQSSRLNLHDLFVLWLYISLHILDVRSWRVAPDAQPHWPARHDITGCLRIFFVGTHCIWSMYTSMKIIAGAHFGPTSASEWFEFH